MMQKMAETNDGNHCGESDGEPWFFSENFGRATAASQYFLQVWFDDVMMMMTMTTIMIMIVMVFDPR